MRISARGAALVIGATLLAGIAAPLADAASGQAGASKGWRVVKIFGCGGGIVRAVTSTGRRGAWAAGEVTRCSDGSPESFVGRWDGRSWRELPLPNALASSGIVATAALSDSYSWMIVDDDAYTGSAWLYRGGQWLTFQLPGLPNVSSAVVFSRSDAWAFGVASMGGDSYAVRFNGRAWRQVRIPVLAEATAAPAPANIWAVGPLPVGLETSWQLAHWTGRWQVVPLPDPGKGAQIFAAWVDWDNADGAWVVASYTVTNGHIGAMLLHWTGGRWRKVTYPYRTNRLGPMAHDGHGGLWLASDSCTCNYTDMVHYSPGRGWSKPVPAGRLEIEAMRFIPRTASVWAGGILNYSLHNPNGRAVILKYGP